MIGYVSQRVLGQYEVSLLGGDAPPRLLFVAPNLRKAVRELDVDPDAFHRWIAPTSSRTCSSSRACPGCATTWAGWCAQYLSTVEVRIERGAAGGLPSLPTRRSSSRPSARAGWPRWSRPGSSAR